MKTCTRCQLAKDLDAFRAHPKHGQPLSWCKHCESKRRTQRRIERRRTDHAYNMVQSAHRRAANGKLPFDLVAEDLQVPEHCPILGFKLKRNADRPGPDSYSLDRTRPELGYVKGNVSVMSHRANTIKSNASPEELAAILEKIYGWTCVPPT